MKESPAFSNEEEQRNIVYLQSQDRLLVPWNCIQSIDNQKLVLMLMQAANIDRKHRTELWTILNKTSQGHLA